MTNIITTQTKVSSLSLPLAKALQCRVVVSCTFAKVLVNTVSAISILFDDDNVPQRLILFGTK